MHQKSGIVPQGKNSRNYRKIPFTQRNNENVSSVTQKKKAKWDAPFETMGETLQGPYTTVKQEECESFSERTNRKKGAIEKMRGKKMKVRQSTQHNYENGLSMTQEEVIKWSIYFQTIEKHHRDLV